MPCKAASLGAIVRKFASCGDVPRRAATHTDVSSVLLPFATCDTLDKWARSRCRSVSGWEYFCLLTPAYGAGGDQKRETSSCACCFPLPPALTRKTQNSRCIKAPPSPLLTFPSRRKFLRFSLHSHYRHQSVNLLLSSLSCATSYRRNSASPAL